MIPLLNCVLKGKGVDHGAEGLDNVSGDEVVRLLLQMTLGILFTDVAVFKLFWCHDELLSDGFLVRLSETEQVGQLLFIVAGVGGKVLKGK